VDADAAPPAAHRVRAVDYGDAPLFRGVIASGFPLKTTAESIGELGGRGRQCASLVLVERAICCAVAATSARLPERRESAIPSGVLLHRPRDSLGMHRAALPFRRRTRCGVHRGVEGREIPRGPLARRDTVPRLGGRRPAPSLQAPGRSPPGWSLTGRHRRPERVLCSDSLRTSSATTRNPSRVPRSAPRCRLSASRSVWLAMRVIASHELAISPNPVQAAAARTTGRRWGHGVTSSSPARRSLTVAARPLGEGVDLPFRFPGRGRCSCDATARLLRILTPWPMSGRWRSCRWEAAGRAAEIICCAAACSS